MNRHRDWVAGWCVVMAAALTVGGAAAKAGPIFLAGRLGKDGFVADKDVQGPCYTVRYSTVTAVADAGDDAVATRVEETILGPQAGAKTVCIIPLGAGVVPGGVKVATGPSQGGETALRPVAAKYLAPKEAQGVYEAIARGTGSVAILALSGRGMMLVENFELKGTVRMVVRLRQKVRRASGMAMLECPMPAAKWAKGPVGRLSVKVTVRSAADRPLRAMFSPTHTVTVDRKGLHEAVVRAKADNWSGEDDFRLCYVADGDELGLRVLTHRPAGDEDGYFMLVGNPTGGARGGKAIEKDVLFVLDTSGSMRGEKIEQARAAIEYCLARLGAGDRFNVVTFGTAVRSFRTGPVVRSEANLAAAREFVEDAVARGRTNIGGAMGEALAGGSAGDRPRIMIFLTDGTPTAGELAGEKIIENVKLANQSKVRIFVMGVGHDVNAHLLDRLAEVTDGSSEYADPDEDIDVKVATLYDRLSHPVLTDVTVAMGGLRTTSVYPRKLPVLFKGTEIMVFGRYRGGGEHTVTLSGTQCGRKVTYSRTVTFPPAAGGADREFIAPLWASRKIGYLLQEIRLHGENKELIAEVVRLSKKYGIVTEYTDFLARAGGDVSSELAFRGAAERMRVANGLQAGGWAVQQARNDRYLQDRVVANGDGNRYVDRRGNVVTNRRIRQIGRQVFYLRDGQWVDAAETGQRKTRVVKLFSNEYFDLLRSHRDFARAQRVGWNVAMNVGAERIVVEKDGKQKIEAQRDRTPPRNDQRNFRQQQINQLPNGLRQIRNNVDVDQLRNVRRAPADEKKKEDGR